MSKTKKKSRQRKRSPAFTSSNANSSDGPSKRVGETETALAEVFQRMKELEAIETDGKGRKKVGTTWSADVEGDGDDFLCTAISDLVLDLPSPPPSWQLWSMNSSNKISKALQSCDEGHCRTDKNGGKTPTIDFRGTFAHNVKALLVTVLNACSYRPSIRKVNLRVGCKKHGVGKGKLRDLIIDLLRHDPELIVWNLKSEDFIISVKLDGRRDYSALGWGLNEGYNPLTFEDYYEEDAPPKKAYLSGKDGSLCTIVCDFLFSIPTPPGQCWEEGTTLKILAGLGKCYQGASEKDKEGSYTVDLRALCGDEAKQFLIDKLNCQPGLQFLKVIVGCKLHGVGDGKLKDMVCDMLNQDEKIKWKFVEVDSIISIELDGRKSYTSLGCDSSNDDSGYKDYHGCEHIFSPRLPLDYDFNYEDYLSKRYTSLGCDSGNDDSDYKDYHGCEYIFSPHQPLDYDFNYEDFLSFTRSSVSTDLIIGMKEEGEFDGDTLVEAYESSMNDSLCTIVCDFLSDLPVRLDQGWDEETNLKLLAGFQKCNECSSDSDIEGSYLIDIRGRYVEDAKTVLMEHLKCQSGHLNVIVGCKVHGVGEGKLKDLILEWLGHDLNIKAGFDQKLSIVHIKLDELLEEKKMSWKYNGPAIFYDFSEDFLCTTFCDLLLDLPSPTGSWEPCVRATYMKVLAGLRSCDKGHCEMYREDTQSIDLRGLFAVEAKELLVTALNCWSLRPTGRYVNVRVGCRKHGVGKGKLRDMICDLLMLDKIDWNFMRHDFIISITLDGREDYSSLGWGSSAGSQPSQTQEQLRNINIGLYKNLKQKIGGEERVENSEEESRRERNSEKAAGSVLA